MDVPKTQSSVDEAQWEEKVKAYHLPRAEINKVNSGSVSTSKLIYMYMFQAFNINCVYSCRL